MLFVVCRAQREKKRDSIEGQTEEGQYTKAWYLMDKIPATFKRFDLH